METVGSFQKSLTFVRDEQEPMNKSPFNIKSFWTSNEPKGCFFTSSKGNKDIKARVLLTGDFFRNFTEGLIKAETPQPVPRIFDDHKKTRC